MKKSTLRSTFLFLLIFIPVMSDQITGYMQQELEMNLSVSQIVKGIYTAIFIFYLLIYRPENFIIISLFFITFILNIATSLIHSYNWSAWLLNDVIFFSKIMTFPLTYFVFKNLNNRYPAFFKNYFVFIYLGLFIIILIAIVISPLGYGNNNYQQIEGELAYGYKGYFIAGNELSALYILIYTFWCFHFYYKSTNLVKTFIAILLGLVLAGLIVTKTALISFIVITLLTPIMLGHFLNKAEKSLLPLVTYIGKLIKILAFLCVLSLTVLIVIFRDRIDSNIERMSENFEKAESFNSFMLSGRDDRFQQSIVTYTEHYTWSQKLFGGGWEYPQSYIQSHFLDIGTSEVDYLDILVSYGAFGVLIIYGFWFFILFYLIRQYYKKNISVYIVPSLLSFSLIFFNSFLSGHIIYSALTGFYLAIFINTIVISNKFNLKSY